MKLSPVVNGKCESCLCCVFYIANADLLQLFAFLQIYWAANYQKDPNMCYLFVYWAIEAFTEIEVILC